VSSPEAASTMPSDRPNFILARREIGDHHRHAPLEFFRIVDRLDAANTVRGCASPMSSVSFSSFSAPFDIALR